MYDNTIYFKKCSKAPGNLDWLHSGLCGNSRFQQAALLKSVLKIKMNSLGLCFALNSRYFKL